MSNETLSDKTASRFASVRYEKVAEAVRYVQSYQADQPSLADIATHLDMSEYHLQRLFAEWVGVSPKQYLQFLTKESAKRALKKHSVESAALEAGLSGSSRLHDLMLRWEAMTPGEYKNSGAGLLIRFGVCDTPFGRCLLASTEKGICKLAFFDTEVQRGEYIEELKKEWSASTLIEDPDAISVLARQIFSKLENAPDHSRPLRVLMKGSPFQLKVWEALLAVPEGQVWSYQQLADSMHQPDAVRAVASAIARNSIGYLIPCHRVIRSSGEISQYRWGAERKQLMLAWEACREDA